MTQASEVKGRPPERVGVTTASSYVEDTGQNEEMTNQYRDSNP